MVNVNKGSWIGESVGHSLKPFQIYLIGSLRNPKVIELGQELRSIDRVTVFDDWYSAGHEADDKWKEYCDQRGWSFKESLAAASAQNVFNFDRTNLLASDVVILVAPAGKSGHLEFGWSAGKGKHAIYYYEDTPERYDVMVNFASYIALGRDDLVEHISTLNLGDK